MFLIYDFAFLIFGILSLPFYILRGRLPRGLSKRWGRISPEVLAALKPGPVVWVHAVSVGEVMAARTLIEAFKSERPKTRVLLSTVTSTGQALARKAIPSADALIYFPLDFSWVVRRMIDQVQPSLFVFLETELWPNFLGELARRKVPTVLVNGRISRRSYPRYRLIAGFFRLTLRRITLFLMQSQEDAQRIISLGAPRPRVRVTGNMKFDALAREPEPGDVGGLGRRILKHHPEERLLVCGSTHGGEEAKILEAFQALREAFPKFRLLLAPRHLHRISEVQRLVARKGFQSVLFSQTKEVDGGGEVILLDTLGDLRFLYRYASFVFVGGSLVPHGGHNCIEPARFGKPIVFGPHMQNFQDIAELFVMKGAASQVRTLDELIESVQRWIFSPQEADEIGARARRLVEENEGATLRNVRMITEILDRIT